MPQLDWSLVTEERPELMVEDLGSCTEVTVMSSPMKRERERNTRSGGNPHS